MLVLVCGPLLNDIIGYEFGCDTDNPPSDSVEVGTNFASFVDLVAGTTYYCRVRAKDPFGYGSWSTVATGVPETLTVDETVMDLPMYQNAGWNNNGASQITWANHTLLWKGNSYNIAGGNAGANIFVYWNSSAPTTYVSAATMPLETDTWMLCYRSGNLVFPAVQSPIINGGLIHANTMHANRITAGTLYIGNIVGSTGSLNFTSSGSINFASASGNFAVSAGNIVISSSATFTVTATAGMNISTANGILVQAGSGISLAGNATTPGLLKIYRSGMTGNYVMLGGYSTQYILMPNTAGTELLYFGNGTYYWNNVNMHVGNTISLYANRQINISAASGYAAIEVRNNNTVAIWATDGFQLTGNKLSTSSTNIPGFHTTTYTGDGNLTSYNITGLPGYPRYVRIWRRGVAGSVECWERSALDSANTSGVMGTSHQKLATRGIKGFSTNAFTVWGSADPNVSGTTYEAMIWY
jgi:hypothetical protein